MIEIISLIISVIALVTSVAVAVQQINIAKQSNFLPILIDMFSEFRSPKFKRHLYYVTQRLSKEHNSKKGFQNLPEPARTHVITVSHFFDNLGVIVANKIVDEKLVISFMGESIYSAWQALEPFIKRERELRNSEYQEYFEDLVVRVKKNPPHIIRKQLGLQELTSS